MPRNEVMRNMLAGENLAIITSRLTKGEDFQHVQVTRKISEAIVMSPKTSNNGFLFPLYVYPETDLSRGFPQHAGFRRNLLPNLALAFLQKAESTLGLKFRENNRGDTEKSFCVEDLVHYFVGILHSPSYRSRYAEFLRIDFPRLPLTSNPSLFRQLSCKGGDLVALHLLEDDYPAASWNVSKPSGNSPLKNLITKFVGKGDAEVAKGYPKYADEKVFINPSRYFEAVPEKVWNFHIGGYQVCEKWLKDRRGRTLSAEDILHYQRVVVALNETIRLMAEIDKVIESHGGWPGAFITGGQP
jgi:predicted helicase